MDANGFRLVRRRSDRIYNKHRSEVLFASCDGPLGIFCLLPLELNHAILDHLAHPDLANLSATSSTLAGLIREYLISCRHLEALLFPNVHCHEHQTQAGALRDQFVSLGNLLRSVTCLMPAKERFRLLTSVLGKLQSVHSLILKQSGSTAAYSCFGAMLKQLVNGWAFNDKRSVFQMIWQEACLETRCKQIFASTAGSFPFHEIDIRLLIRNVFLQSTTILSEVNGKEVCQMPLDFLCWLTLLLRPWPLVHQARLLVTLFGPLHPATGTVDWQKLCTTTTNGSCGKQDLAELAFVVSSLYMSQSYASSDNENAPRQLAWVPDQIISIVDEATALPQGWSLDNMGRLLQLLCRPLTVNLLQCYAANGRLSELAHLVLHMAIVCADDDSTGLQYPPGAEEVHSNKAELTYFVEVLREVLSIFTQPIRKQFLQQFYNTWHEHVMDTLHISVDSIQMNLAVHRMTKMCEVLSQYIFV
eukprot:scpid71206/ scgid3113/ F-box only protein 47